VRADGGSEGILRERSVDCDELMIPSCEFMVVFCRDALVECFDPRCVYIFFRYVVHYPFIDSYSIPKRQGKYVLLFSLVSIHISLQCQVFLRNNLSTVSNALSVASCSFSSRARGCISISSTLSCASVDYLLDSLILLA